MVLNLLGNWIGIFMVSLPSGSRIKGDLVVVWKKRLSREPFLNFF